MTLDDLYPLYDADRGTLSTAGQRSLPAAGYATAGGERCRPGLRSASGSA